jgi:hypothetical protein
MEGAAGSRTSGNADMARRYHDKFAAIEVVSVIRKHACKMVNLALQGRTRQAKENDTGVRTVLVKYQLAEIPVSDNKNPSLLPGNCQDLLICEAMRILAGDRDNVMTKVAKVGDQAKISTLVEQEVHRLALERAPLGGLGETSCPVRISLA